MDNSKKHLPIPEWMSKNDEYIPQKDQDTFVNKSILSVIGLISRIKAQEASGVTILDMNATLKVFFTFALLLMISLSRSFAFVMIVNVYLLVVLNLLDSYRLIKILKMSFGMALFTAVIMFPAFLWGNHYSFIMITSKIWATITSMGLIAQTTKWNAITASLKRFHIPDVFILVLDVTIKYMYLLGEFSLNMLYSLKLRSVGRNNNKYTSMAGIAGTIFLQSKEMAEDMYHAMECRGFSGEYQIIDKLKFYRIDYLYIAINIGFIILFVYFGRISS